MTKDFFSQKCVTEELWIYVCSTSPDRPGDLKESFDVECLDGDFVSRYYITQSMKYDLENPKNRLNFNSFINEQLTICHLKKIVKLKNMSWEAAVEFTLGISQ